MPPKACVGTRSCALAGVLLAGVLLAAGCSSGVPAKDWAGRVCAAVQPWRATIGDLNSRAQQQMSAATTPVQTRDNLLDLLGGARDASEVARGAVVAAGVPDVDGGDAAAQRFADALAKIRDAYARARADLQALPTTDAGSFYDRVVAVLARLQTDYAATGVDTSAIDSSELSQAFAGASQCR